MAARLAFAVCAHADADILIVDEALSVGDEAFGAKCDAFIRISPSAARSSSFRTTSQSLEVLCDRVIWIEDGVVHAMGPATEVISDYREALEDKPAAAMAAGF